MPIDVDYSHTSSVLGALAGESPSQEWPSHHRTMQPVTRSDRRRLRQARKLARLLVSLDDCARSARPALARRSHASLGAAR